MMIAHDTSEKGRGRPGTIRDHDMGEGPDGTPENAVLPA
jgi:hypothetical protein